MLTGFGSVWCVCVCVWETHCIVYHHTIRCALVPADCRRKAKTKILNPTIICFQLPETHDCSGQEQRKKVAISHTTTIPYVYDRMDVCCVYGFVYALCVICPLLINERPDKQIPEKNIDLALQPYIYGNIFPFPFERR